MIFSESLVAEQPITLTRITGLTEHGTVLGGTIAGI